MSRKFWGRVGSRTSIQVQVGVTEIFWDNFGVAKRKGLGTAASLECEDESAFERGSEL